MWRISTMPLHQATAEAIIFFAKVLKERYQGKIVGAFYGSYGCTDFFNRHDGPRLLCRFWTVELWISWRLRAFTTTGARRQRGSA